MIFDSGLYLTGDILRVARLIPLAFPTVSILTVSVFI